MDDYFISHGVALYLVSHRLFPSSLVRCVNSMSASDIQNERRATPDTSRKRAGSGALQMGPRKKPYVLLLDLNLIVTLLCISTTQDPLVHHGRHFGRAVHAFCNVQTLILNGLQAMCDDAPDDESLTAT